MTIYLVLESIDYEGYNEPELAFLKYEDALAELRRIADQEGRDIIDGWYVGTTFGAWELHTLEVKE